MAVGLVRARPRLYVGLAFVVAAGLAGGAAVALVRATAGHGSPPASALAGSPSATPSGTTAAQPTPAPTPLATAGPSATPTPHATPSASPAAVRTYPYPKPARAYDALFFEATSAPQDNTTETVLTIKARDGDGDITFGGLTWGDGTSVAAEAQPTHCPPYPSPTAAPGPYQPKPSSRTLIFRHRYNSAGPFSLLFTVRSGNSTCRPNGPAAESQSGELRLVFSTPATPTPTAS